MNEIYFFMLSIAIFIGGAIWTFRDFKESHENFYFSVSYKIKSMIVEVKNVVFTKDTQSLIEIMFYSLEEHILYIMQHHKFLRKRELDELDVSRYNNLFYVYISGIITEWYINGIDNRLSSLFLEKNKVNLRKHMQQMKLVLLDKSTKPKYRRRKIVSLYLQMLEDIKNDYIAAYDDYVRVLEGEVTFEELVDRSVFTNEEFIKIFKGVHEQVIYDNENTVNTNPNHIIEMNRMKENT